MNKISKVCFFLFLIILVSGCSVQSGEDLNTLTASGTIEADEIKVTSEIPGKIVSLGVAEGQEVQEGQEIARLDDAVLKWQVKQAEAGVAAAEAKLGETKRGSRVEEIRQAESAVSQVQALIQGAKSALSSAQIEYKRVESLLVEGAATQQQLDVAQTQIDNAKSQLDSLSSQYKAAQEQLKLIKSGATRETISTVAAGVDQALATWEVAREQLKKSVITSPQNGVVTEKVVNKGEHVNTGTTIAVISDLNNLRVEIYVPEAELGKVQLGQEAWVSVDAFPDQSFSGKIIYIASEAEFTPQNVQTKEERTSMVFLVKIALENQDGKLKPGMPADVVIGK